MAGVGVCITGGTGLGTAVGERLLAGGAGGRVEELGREGPEGRRPSSLRMSAGRGEELNVSISWTMSTDRGSSTSSSTPTRGVSSAVAPIETSAVQLAGIEERRRMVIRILLWGRRIRVVQSRVGIVVGEWASKRNWGLRRSFV